MVVMDITKRVSVTGDYINSRPSVQAWMAFCCEFPAILLPMGKNRAKSRGFARSGALGLPGAGHGLAACPGVDLSKVEWCFDRWLQFSQNLEELAHGVRPGHADILVLEYEEIAIPRPGLCLPRSAQVQLGQCLRADFSRSAHIALVMQRKRAAHQQLVSSRKRVKNESEESWMALL